GDGASDIPCFSLMNEENGVAIGVYKGSTVQDWNREVQLSTSQRVANLAEADYREDSELMRSLTLAVESMCKQIALSQLSVGE
ncbi:MAG TPA: haloacid dehalogenase-like hydrolase, partial [Cyanobacteria bacterium UBA11162]|nr:haloacid dehalogenase-like hydrolase [Cyanobacteria bacterium UBA11162]